MTDPKAHPGPFDDLPAFAPLATDLPPQMKSALLDLRKALTNPPSLGDKFPFVLPTNTKAKVGRPSPVQPNQVVRLARFIRLGDSVPLAASKVNLSERAARRILSGQVSIAHHEAVTQAEVYLPVMQKRNQPAKPPRNRQDGPGAPETTRECTDTTPLNPAACAGS